jgi:acetyl-CoA carboxylase biotin carboxylase subunit
MIGKLIVHAEDRRTCIERMSRALREFHIEPIKTTIGLHRQLMRNAAFIEGGIDIHFLERLLK